MLRFLVCRRQSNIQFFLFDPNAQNRLQLTEEVHNASAVVSFRFGRIFLQVIRIPNSTWERLSDRPIGVISLWPDAQPGMKWPPENDFLESIDALNVSPGIRNMRRILVL